MSRIKIITSYNDGYAPLGDLSFRSIRLYAASLGYDYEVLPMPAIDRPFAWAKILLLKDQLLTGDHEYVMWVDADAFFVRGDVRVESEFEDGKDLYLTSHNILMNIATPWPNIKIVARRINTGVMILRNSEWSISLLNEIWKQEQFTNHHWWEQAALMSLIGDIAELSGYPADNFVAERWVERVKFVRHEWNSIHHDVDSEHVLDTFDPIIIHLAGVPFDQRIALASRFEFRVVLGKTSQSPE